MDAKVVAVVVTYNRKFLLEECIEALLAQTYKELDICVIDNGSDDGTYDLLKSRQYFERITYKNTHKNLGGAGGFNLGIKYCAKKNYDFIWIMDDDTIPRPDALEKLMHARDILGKPFGFLASCVVWQDGSFCKMNNPGIQKNMLYGYEYQYLNYGIFNIHHASFVSILIPMDIVKNVGLPIREFFIWKDDYEYTSRISGKYPCYFVSGSVVLHKMKSNMLPDIVTDTPDRLGRYVYEYRNEYYLVRKEGKNAKFHYYYNGLKTFIAILRNAQNYKGRRIRIMLTGIIKGWNFRPVIEKVDKL